MPLKRPSPAKLFSFAPMEWVLLGLSLGYCVAGYLVARHYHVADHYSLTLYSKTFTLFSFFIGLSYVVWRLVTIMISRRPRRLLKLLIRDARWNWLSPERLVHAIPVIFAYLSFMGAFTSLKTMIPVMHPYAFDTLLSQWDRALHFGIDPWRLYQHVLGYPLITWAINFIYNFWFAVMLGMIYWQAFSLKDQHLRLRFFFAFFLIWGFIGTVMATLLSSVGPCYYGRLLGGSADPYADQMAYLRATALVYPIWALKGQDLLWSAYELKGLSIGAGISAMPSLHVASSMLFALTGWKTGRRTGILLTGFLMVIIVGSVHLGWHYALDGYVAMILASVLWVVAGKFVTACGVPDLNFITRKKFSHKVKADAKKQQTA